MVGELASHLAARSGDFDAAGFVQAATADFATQELKERSNAIRDALAVFLPEDFDTAVALLTDCLHPEPDGPVTGGMSDPRGVQGWIIMPMADFVALRGGARFSTSMAVLRQMTSRFSAEFAVRPVIAAAPDRALALLQEWTRDANHHVRRLASEGSRPRLPWGMRLDVFVKDPAPLLPLLSALKDDPEEYVRRSVANNLNDISKDHPDLVADIARAWMQDASRDRVRLVRHACRSLVKAGHGPTLAALGYGPAKLEAGGLEIATPVVTFGTALEFRIGLTSRAQVKQPLVVDFIIHHVKADGSRTPKVFKWKVFDLDAGASVTLEKRHMIKPITTRTYYDGLHGLTVQVNGEPLASAGFTLTGVN